MPIFNCSVIDTGWRLISAEFLSLTRRQPLHLMRSLHQGRSHFGAYLPKYQAQIDASIVLNPRISYLFDLQIDLMISIVGINLLVQYYNL